MEKIDYKKKLRHLYSPSAKEPVIVDVPLMNFLMADGQGDPNTSQMFKEAVEALFGLAYTLKFMIKKGPTIERLHEFVEGRGYRITGKHHEMYLSDLRRAAPEKWKTVVRQPIMS